MKPKNFLNSIIKPFFGHRKKEEELEAIAAKEQKVFRYESLVTATNNFSPKLKLGQGGYGPVFKGRLEDGRVVAVKQLGQGSRQGAKEFKNEANLLSKVQHKNVVNLFGYCAHAEDKLLVYEYVANESLDKILFLSPSSNDASNSKRMQLDWKLRYDIMVGIARGLLYLHEDAHTTIVHRDIKASNILLDEKWNPKIADFGMARLFPEDKEKTHVNTRVVGTNGYMAPEYVLHGHLSAKADVYSFGVLILELISGLKNSTFFSVRNVDADNLIEWAWKNFKKGQSTEILDPALRSSADLEQVKMCVHIGLLCTESDPKMRPDMNRVVVVLSKKPSKLEEPTRPGVPSSSFRRKSHGTGVSSYSSSASSSSARNSTSTASIATNTATTSTTSTLISPKPPHRSPIRLKE